MLPRGQRGGDADDASWLDTDEVCLEPFAAGQLHSRAQQAFAPPDELLQEVRDRKLVACAGFQPPPYMQLRRSTYLHHAVREQLLAEDVFVCSCSPLTGGCDERCQNRVAQQECEVGTCPCGELCGNRPFSTQPDGPRPLCAFMTDQKGWIA